MGTVPSPHTWTAGDNATSTVLQTLTDSLLYMLGLATSGGSTRPNNRLRQTVAQSLASGAAGAALTMDTEDVDSDNGHSTVTNTSRYTAQTAGTHDVTGHGQLATPAAAVGITTMWLTVNGVERTGTRVGGVNNTTDGYRGVCVDTIFLNVGDFVELWMAQTSGAAVLTAVSTGSQPSLRVLWRHE